VVFGARLRSNGTSTLQLQVEVEPASTTFTNVANATSSFVSSGTIAYATSSLLSPGNYHWQARAIDSQNVTSTWQLFGSASSTDFIVVTSSVAAPCFQVDAGGTLTTNLISYYQLQSDGNDFYGSNNLANNNSVTFPANGHVQANSANFNGTT